MDLCNCLEKETTRSKFKFFTKPALKTIHMYSAEYTWWESHQVARYVGVHPGKVAWPKYVLVSSVLSFKSLM